MATDSSLWTNEGGNLKSIPLSDYMRTSAQPLYKMRQFADVKQAFGKGKGDNFNWDKCGDVATIGGTLLETSTVPLTTQTITKGTLTVNEYGNGIVFTGKMEALSKFDQQDIIDKGLRNDMVQTLDAAAGAQFDACLLRYVGTATAGFALTTNGTATATNTSVLNEYHIRKMKLELEKRNVPKLAGDTYVLVAALEAEESLEGAMVSVQQYTETGYEKIANGECGMIHGVRIVKENNFTRNTFNLTSRTKTAKTWSGAQALTGYMFGADTVMEAVAIPEEVRQKEITDFGRSKGLCWYFLGGWKIVWDTAGDQRIICWDSLA